MGFIGTLKEGISYLGICLIQIFTLKFYAIKADGPGDLFPLGNYGIK